MLALTGISVIAAFPLLLLDFKCLHLRPIWKHARQIKLEFSPNDLSGVDIIVVMAVFLWRSLRYSILSTCMRISEEPKSPSGDELSLVMPFRVTRTDLDAYSRAIRDQPVTANVELVGLQLLLFLSALSEPAMLLLLAHPACRVRPLGAVNALTCLNGAFLTARLSKDFRTVRRGFEVDLVFAKVRGEVATAAQRHEAHNGKATPVWADSTSLTVKYDDPASWARLCKDYNPIHTSALAAKLFGFPGKLAHGNHVGALAAKYITSTTSQNDPLFMEITFKRPVVVPAQLDLRVSSDVGVTRFQILSKNKVSIEGTVGQLK
ncbi:hypothetical protein AYO20_10045 [Fonsecaea nubica]|uniref:MaoC-like domain-containing protein n=1 Tax=Fonsecaea nubica TaxID=856822 RepID=A0A178CD20_9EURO|nr:hypothetical protein AYO20_10045 [Fonsecaea nubica]OAL26621.1 hypothetical protein AYO20_10045 [Fonsecaea nubica]